jgi:hypothetical protein
METIFYDNRSLLLSWEEAESLKWDMGLLTDYLDTRSYQGIPYSELAIMMRPVAERLIKEIKLSVDYYKDNFKIETMDQILLTGNASRLQGLMPYLQSNLNLPVKTLELSPYLVFNDQTMPKTSHEVFTYTDAIGAALSQDGQYNFLPEKLKTESKYRKATVWLLKSTLILMIIWTVITFLLLLKWNGIKIIDDRQKQSLVQVQQESSEFDRLTKAQDQVLKIKKSLLDDLKRDSSIMRILKLISHAVPEPIVLKEIRYGGGFNDIEANRIKAYEKMEKTASAKVKPELSDKKELTVSGIVYKDVFYADIHLMNLISALHSSHVFSDVMIKEKKRNDTDEKLTFQIQAVE